MVRLSGTFVGEQRRIRAPLVREHDALRQTKSPIATTLKNPYCYVLGSVQALVGAVVVCRVSVSATCHDWKLHGFSHTLLLWERINNVIKEIVIIIRRPQCIAWRIVLVKQTEPCGCMGRD